jgi:DNA replication protein DnaC
VAAAAAQASWQAELRSRAWDARLGRAAIPERFVDRRLETYVPTCDDAERALRIAARYAANFAAVRKAGACLIFCGDVGTGKTHLAIGIAHVVLEQGGQRVFTSVMRAVRSVKETYAKGNSRTEAQAIADLVDPDLLILDEVGIQHGTDTEKLVLFEVINGRYEAARPTIVISNLAIKALEEYLGARASTGCAKAAASWWCATGSRTAVGAMVWRHERARPFSAEPAGPPGRQAVGLPGGGRQDRAAGADRVGRGEARRRSGRAGQHAHGAPAD